MKSALFICKNDTPHELRECSEFFAEALSREGFASDISGSLDTLTDRDYLLSRDLIVLAWPGAPETSIQGDTLLETVRTGVGIASWHIGLVTMSHDNWEYPYMAGGQFVCHPGGESRTYTVHILENDDQITKGLSDFTMCSEQYYLHVDPSNEVLAVSRFEGEIFPWVEGAVKEFSMPVAWKRTYGAGKVFYCSLGDKVSEFRNVPEAAAMVTRGMVWAAR